MDKKTENTLTMLKKDIEKDLNMGDIFAKNRKLKFVKARSIFNKICIEDLKLKYSEVVSFYKLKGRTITHGTIIHSKNIYVDFSSTSKIVRNIYLKAIFKYNRANELKNQSLSIENGDELLKLHLKLKSLDKEQFNEVVRMVDNKIKSFSWKTSINQTKVYQGSF